MLNTENIVQIHRKKLGDTLYHRLSILSIENTAKSLK